MHLPPLFRRELRCETYTAVSSFHGKPWSKHKRLPILHHNGQGTMGTLRDPCILNFFLMSFSLVGWVPCCVWQGSGRQGSSESNWETRHINWKTGYDYPHYFVWRSEWEIGDWTWLFFLLDWTKGSRWSRWSSRYWVRRNLFTSLPSIILAAASPSVLHIA